VVFEKWRQDLGIPTETAYPRDDRPRRAINIARDYARQGATTEDLGAALILARDATELMPEAHDTRWLLLIHQIPPKPDYLRVKIWRRLQRVGAVAIKNSVYVMPRSDQSLEDFQWTVREISEGGGDAWICEAGFVEGISNDQVEALFRAARDADYAAISEDAKELVRKFPVRKGGNEERAGELEAAVARLRRRLGEVVGIDFFDCLGRQSAEGMVASLEARLNSSASGDDQAAASSGEYRGRVWVTRKGIHVDRMASAWLIKRFIDREAKFKLVPARGYQPEKREIGFDKHAQGR
jgi:hypothetical protein